MKKRIFCMSMILALCLSFLTGLAVPAEAAGTGQAIQLVSEGNPTGGIADWDADKGWDHVYFGKDTTEINCFDGCFRVLDADRTNTGEAGMFLLTERLTGDPASDGGGVCFDENNASNEWQGSTAQSWCKSLLTECFSQAEQAAILATTKDDDGYKPSSLSFPYRSAKGILNGDKLFYLSGEEAENAAYGFTDNASRTASFKDRWDVYWRLRSPVYSDTGIVGYEGALSTTSLNWSFLNGSFYAYNPMEPGARPALNLDWSSVRFTSAAENGKVSGETGPGALRAVPAYTGTDWKLTLADSSRDGFTASVTGVDGDALRIKYSGAAAGENEMISAVIVSSAGAVTYYGNLAPASSAANSVCAVDVTGKMSPGDTLYVFNEQVNGDRMSDYAGPPVKLMTSVSSGTTRLTGGWYCVTGDVTVDDRITVSGRANLVLCDGAILRAKKGIELPARNMYSLTIWGQKEGAGRLIAAGGLDAAGIGGSFGKSGGALTINGGQITATGGKSAAGIGGGGSGGGGEITINGGTVEAKAGSGMAQAIGHGNLNKTEGSLRIHQNAKVTAGDASPGQPAAAANRADACRSKWARIERCTVHSFENDICKWCGGAIAVAGSLKDGTLRYSVTAPAGAQVIAARYDGGRMTDAQTVTLAAGDVDGVFTMKGSGTGYKLFLLDGATRAPLCPAWSGGA